MNIPLIGDLNWQDWVKGIVGGFIGGGAAALTTAGSLAVLDPNYFASHPAGYAFRLIGQVFVANGVIGAALYLKQNTFPGVREVTKTIETVKQPAEGPKVTTTVQEKTTEPIPPAKP